MSRQFFFLLPFIFRDNDFYVATFFQCVFNNSSHLLLRYSFECRDIVRLPFALFFVATKLSSVMTFFTIFCFNYVVIDLQIVVTNSLCLLHKLCHNKVVECCDILSTILLDIVLTLCCDIVFQCCDILLLVALNSCRDNAGILS